MRLKKVYSPEIDGFRAVAVFLVIFYHLGFSWVPGGYLGVDVFFVISGYLISGQILRQLQENRFSFSSFYARRIRRLFPAMLATILGTLLIGIALLSLSDLRRLGTSALTSLFGFSNFYFSGKIDYFSAEAALSPLLHFWSLAVEEQYYLGAPILVFLVYQKFSFRAVLIVTWAALLISFIAATLLFESMKEDVFYWPFFRIWEFALGGLLIWLGQSSKRISTIITVFGFCLILSASVFMPYQLVGWAPTNLLACLGAAFVIAASDNSFRTAIFGNPIMVGLGRISYSLYLVHWPIIMFLLYVQTQAELTLPNKLIVIIASILLALLMYHFVEQRFRKPVSNLKINMPSKFFVGCLSAVFGVSLLATSIAMSNGWAWRLVTDIVQTDVGYGKCLRQPLCSLGLVEKRAEPFDILLIGDSHATHLSFGLNELALKKGKSLLAATSPACSLTLGTPLPTVNIAACISLRNNIASILSENPDAFIIIAHRWAGYGSLPEVLDKYSALLAKRPPNSVGIIGQSPGAPNQKFKCGASHKFLLPADICSPFVLNENLAQMSKTIEAFSKQNGFMFSDPQSHLCTENACMVAMDNRAFYFDSHHMTQSGSIYLVEKHLNKFLPDL